MEERSVIAPFVSRAKQTLDPPPSLIPARDNLRWGNSSSEKRKKNKALEYGEMTQAQEKERRSFDQSNKGFYLLKDDGLFVYFSEKERDMSKSLVRTKAEVKKKDRSCSCQFRMQSSLLSPRLLPQSISLPSQCAQWSSHKKTVSLPGG